MISGTGLRVIENINMLDIGLSIVIPVYGSEKSIALLCEQAVDVCHEKLPSLLYEIILVNDSSPDDVAVVIESLCKRFPQIRCLTMLRNFGQHNALLAGIREARFDRVITMDDDGQHPALFIPMLVASLTGSLDLVYACPATTQKHNLWRNFASALVKCLLNRALGIGGADNISSFRIFRTEIRNVFAKYDGPTVFIDALLSWGTRRVGVIRVEHQTRIAGESGYTLKKLLAHALNMVTSFSVIPLRLTSFVGLLTIIFGMLTFSVSLFRFLTVGREVPGFMFLLSTVILFSGVQLLSLGIIGEYIARVHIRLMNRPAYVVKQQDS